MAGELETCTQRIEIAKHFQTLFRDFGQGHVLLGGQVRIGANLAAPDAPAQLIELGEAETVGAVYNDRVGAGNVESAFDDRGREQHFVFLLVEGAHPLFHLAGGHLAMRGNDLHLRDVVVQPFGQGLHVRNARYDDEALPAAMMLAQQGLAHHHVVPLHNVCPHGQTVDGRGLDGREFAQA